MNHNLISWIISSVTQKPSKISIPKNQMSEKMENLETKWSSKQNPIELTKHLELQNLTSDLNNIK